MMTTPRLDQDTLVHLTRTDPDPRVRHRAHLLLAYCAAPTLGAAARQCRTDGRYLRKWRDRFVDEGRDGLADRPRPGRPRQLGADAEAILGDALEHTPLDYHYPTATWTIVDLRDHLAQAGWDFALATVARAVHRLGYVYRRPKHDLRHRQDAEAVASAKHVLEQLQKKGVLEPACASSTLTNAPSTPTPVWQRAGSAAASPDRSRRQDRTGGPRCSAPSTTDPAK